MNRKEAVNYLMDNNKGVAKCLDDCYIDEYYVWLKNGVIVCGNEKYSSDCFSHFQIHVKNDDAKFEVVRELRKMSFGEAVWHFYDKDIYISNEVVSCETGTCYWSTEERDLKLHELKGLWTVKGQYEQSMLDLWN